MKEYSFKVPSMHDEASAKEIRSAIVGMRGIEDVDVNYEDGSVNVYFDQNQVVEDKIKYVIEKKGFKVKNL
ncbi:heavy-metal-associated domain-containing protein [Fonticella tunisiensis]|uniref:Copper chaperone CopZ n=1 Tax=Fonticella tunisiensis TaxID=1096341 RepID=A0A4R7KST5_9CLOT|nr:heavy-metal-associated domain-containing protein [Fonticella tunisiensis]TDT60908.1 copper chaperone CopZ [Fonticella tunisiensis]